MLDFAQITVQIREFAADRLRALPQQQAAWEEARRRLHESGPLWEETQTKIAHSRTSWLVAAWHEPPDRAHAAPPRPLPCTVLAADGSQIVSDRHDITLCYLINVGLIALRYGTGERATLTSRPSLAPPDDDLLDEFQGEQAVIVPKRLAMRRLLAEFAGLAAMIVENAPAASGPTLALSDGSLILWPLETEHDEFRAASLAAFESHLETARQHNVPIVGYISQPTSRDVVNALRVFRCPHPQANCDRYCPHRQKPKPHYVAPDCAGTERLTDADLFFDLLQPGERSAVFGSRSQILGSYRPDNRICFFYLHTGLEVARVEIPAWAATDPDLLALTHALCYDQAQKGDGYPVALAEAHEQAIVRGAERAAFFHLMEREFVHSRLPVAVTRKAASKRARRV
jgi:hypothetical protein